MKKLTILLSLLLCTGVSFIPTGVAFASASQRAHPRLAEFNRLYTRYIRSNAATKNHRRPYLIVLAKWLKASSIAAGSNAGAVEIFSRKPDPSQAEMAKLFLKEKADAGKLKGAYYKDFGAGTITEMAKVSAALGYQDIKEAKKAVFNSGIPGMIVMHLYRNPTTRVIYIYCQVHKDDQYLEAGFPIVPGLQFDHDVMNGATKGVINGAQFEAKLLELERDNF